MNRKQFSAARRKGYRSGLEVKVAESLDSIGQKYRYEKVKIEWEDLSYRTYTPDFVLTNNIIIETKGLFTSPDRRKHVQIKKQHPELDIRFVFTNSKAKLYKGAKNTYGQWCIQKGFKYYDRIIPEDWLTEEPNDAIPSFIDFKGTKRK
tara:strand:+ start:685 stop:1131 length:447 start_codon:yes stop_codon:yes gene_type:complete